MAIFSVLLTSILAAVAAAMPLSEPLAKRATTNAVYAHFIVSKSCLTLHSTSNLMTPTLGWQCWRLHRSPLANRYGRRAGDWHRWLRMYV